MSAATVKTLPAEKKKEKVEIEVMSPEMVQDFVSSFRLPIESIRALRYVDKAGTLYQIDDVGGGRFLLRPVGE